MTEKILKQKRLMQKAVDCLDSIQNVERVFLTRDFFYARQRIDELQSEYADLIQQLTECILTDTGFKIKEMEVA